MTGLTRAVTPSSLHVVLVEPEIHWNTGNAGRTCLATGAQLHLVGPLGFSLDERQVRRAGLDYWARVAPRMWGDWQSFETALADLGEAYFFSADAERTYWDETYSTRRPVVLVFGKESTGLAPALRDRFRNRLLAVPILDRSSGEDAAGVRSLNLSTTVALAAYEVLRQRHCR